MKLFLLLTGLSFLLLSNDKCAKKNATGKYKARLEIAGICLNYTIKLLEGDMDTAKIVLNWTDEMTGKAYTNVFAPANPCLLPKTIRQGDEFYFTIDSPVKQECITCLAYYPKPPKTLPVVVVEK